MSSSILISEDDFKLAAGLLNEDELPHGGQLPGNTGTKLASPALPSPSEANSSSSNNDEDDSASAPPSVAESEGDDDEPEDVGVGQWVAIANKPTVKMWKQKVQVRPSASLQEIFVFFFCFFVFFLFKNVGCCSQRQKKQNNNHI